MKNDDVTDRLLKSANENGVVYTLYGAFGKNVKVTLPFSQKSCNASIDELDFSVRALNALKRASIFTVGEAIDLIANDGLLAVRNLGKKTQSEIKTRIMVFGYEQLTENEKRQFFRTVSEANRLT